MRPFIRTNGLARFLTNLLEDDNIPSGEELDKNIRHALSRLSGVLDVF